VISRTPTTSFCHSCLLQEVIVTAPGPAAEDRARCGQNLSIPLAELVGGHIYSCTRCIPSGSQLKRISLLSEFVGAMVDLLLHRVMSTSESFHITSTDSLAPGCRPWVVRVAGGSCNCRIRAPSDRQPRKISCAAK
jgi:hypothetical protein